MQYINIVHAETHAIASLLAVMQVNSYFYFSELEEGLKRKGGRGNKRGREAICVCDGEEETMSEVCRLC